jgi:type IV pilus assembly protein PilV
MQGDACLTKTGGFSLLEVLVASVLFGVGLAAIISLKLFTLSSSQMASNRYKALMLITDMAERIRSNPVGGILALYNFDGSVGIPNTHCANAQCTSAELAQFDLWRWQDSMRNAVSLQGSSGRIEYHNDGSYTIEVSWLNTEAQQPENKSFSQRIYFFSAEEIALMVPP